MLIWLWNYMRGYVVIEVWGFSVERFVNLAAHRGIYIWNVVYTDKGVTMSVSARAFRLLKGCGRKTGCHMRIRGKHGWPFFIYKYRKRKILAAGVVLFVAAMYALSSFVWLINIEGTQRLPRHELLDALSAEGLRAGVFKRNINTKQLEKRMLNRFEDIAWIDIYIKGTTAAVRVKETIPRQEIIDRDAPCDIIAKKDGLIVSVVVSAGTPLVKPSDVVRKGGTLVSGRLEVTDEATGQPRDYAYVHAAADVTAKLYYEINLDVAFNYEEKKYTGRMEKKYSFSIFGRKINLFISGNTYKNYDKIITRRQVRLGEYYPLPFVIITEEYREFFPEIRTRSVEQAKELAERLVSRRLAREFDPAAEVTERFFEYAEREDALEVTALVATIELIGETVILAENHQ
ncbi:MAG: sporulation protein YqfD [Clostridiales bacterium]|jgi:similar to stage IV sporulation protein|nr:sporulation protein YqfD [Clostridiales bacterium]